MSSRARRDYSMESFENYYLTFIIRDLVTVSSDFFDGTPVSQISKCEFSNPQ